MDTAPKNMSRQKVVSELVIIVGLSIATYIFSSRYDILERIVRFSLLHENWELDEIIVVSIFLVLALAFFSVQRWQDLRRSETVLTHRNQDLQKALSEIKQLRGIIPICSRCKRIRDDEGYWQQIESYIHDHSDAEFSHGICPDCMEKLYPDFMGEINKKDEHRQ